MSIQKQAEVSAQMLATLPWLTFSADHDKGDAVRRFGQRFGRMPEHVVDDRRWRVPTLKVGPAPEVK